MSKQTANARPAYSYSSINWVTAIFMVLFHVGALAAFWFTTWTHVIVALVLHWFAVGLGISLGYHRLHTHRGYKTSKAFEYFLAVCGTLTLEGGPIFWGPRTASITSTPTTTGSAHAANGGCGPHGWILFGDTHHNNTELGPSTRGLAADPFYRWRNVSLRAVDHARVILLAVGGWPLVRGALPPRRRRLLGPGW